MSGKQEISFKLKELMKSGTEIILKSFINKEISNSRIVVFGDYQVMQAAHDLLKIRSFRLNSVNNISECSYHREILNIFNLNLIGKDQLQKGRERIEKVTKLADLSMKRLLGKSPRIAVAGLNPHSGENGLFGDEEIREIIPAIKNMKSEGLNVEGPVPPDTVFLKAVNGMYDVVVAMYHDQGHIPLKLLGFNTGVNITVGPPFIRTSVDHGTAFEIAWKGKASEVSMVEAIKLAHKLLR
jgi:4-hydroxy-L-threonine phosphate dehydrogenase PdxA